METCPPGEDGGFAPLPAGSSPSPLRKTSAPSIYTTKKTVCAPLRAFLRCGVSSTHVQDTPPSLRRIEANTTYRKSGCDYECKSQPLFQEGLDRPSPEYYNACSRGFSRISQYPKIAADRKCYSTPALHKVHNHPTQPNPAPRRAKYITILTPLQAGPSSFSSSAPFGACKVPTADFLFAAPCARFLLRGIPGQYGSYWPGGSN